MGKAISCYQTALLLAMLLPKQLEGQLRASTILPQYSGLLSLFLSLLLFPLCSSCLRFSLQLEEALLCFRCLLVKLLLLGCLLLQGMVLCQNHLHRQTLNARRMRQQIGWPT